MAIQMPDCPLPNESTPFLRDFGGVLTPFLGGPEQRINRIGTRFGVRFTMPELDGEEARAYVAKLLRGRFDRVVMPWPQTVYDGTDPGSPAINIGVSGGSAISVKSLTPGYVVAEGQFFSIIHASRRYVYMSTGVATANGSGFASLAIFPALRTAVSTNDVIEMATPMIEGFVSPGDELAWSHGIDLMTSIPFSVVESK